MKKTGIIVQARMGSSRLPGKVVRELAGRPMLEHIIARLQRVAGAQSLIVATTVENRDEVVAAIARRSGADCFRGGEGDVLGRYYDAARRFDLGIVVRVCADCPLIDPAVIDEMLATFAALDGSIDYLSNTLVRSYPRGLDAEIFTFSALEKAFHEARQDYEREHVTPYIWQHPERFRLRNHGRHPDLSRHRWTVDTAEDFELISKIYSALYRESGIFLLDDVLRLLEKHPQWPAINRHVKQKPVDAKG